MSDNPDLPDLREYLLRRQARDVPDASGPLPEGAGPPDSTGDGAGLAAAFAGLETGAPHTTAPTPPTADDDSTLAGWSPKPAGVPDRIGRYKTLDELGRGSFGTVYRCRDEQLDRDVAVKLFNGAAAAMYGELDDFLHEAKAAARLHHPGVVTVLDAGRTEEGQGFIVYEFVRGSTLKGRFAAQPFDRADAMRWVMETAEALHAAHKCGIVHRDVKPANILIDEQGKARLADFGIAKIDDRFILDDAGEVVGTMAYMSPEQACGQSHWASPQSDVYSLGAVLYELLCWRTPFSGKTAEEIRQQAIGRPVQPPRTIDDSISKELEAICLKALAKRPEDRFKTAADMAAELRAAVAPPRRRSAVPWLAGAPAVVVMALAALWTYNQRTSTEQPQSPNANQANGEARKAVGRLIPAAWEDVRNERAPFMVRVDVDHADRIYQGGDVMFVHVVSERDGYLYLLYKQADGSVNCLFPNKVQQDNRILGHKAVTVPSMDAGFRIRIGPPYGREVLKAIVVGQPLPNEIWGVESLTKAQWTPLQDDGVKGAMVEVSNRPDWAEHQVHITTISPDQHPPSAPARRLGLFVGVGQYQDTRIAPLQVCARNAQRMAEIMKKDCRLDDAIVLVDHEATRANIEKAICTTLAKGTQPNDTVFLYWSGRSGRTAQDASANHAATTGHLAPFDGQMDGADDSKVAAPALARWLQGLDGRKLVLIFDTCDADGAQSVPPTAEPRLAANFLDAELGRTKGVGQAETVKLCASTGSDRAMVWGERQLSAMTGVLIDLLASANGPVTMPQAYEQLKVLVPKHQREISDNIERPPALMDNTSEPISLRP